MKLLLIFFVSYSIHAKYKFYDGTQINVYGILIEVDSYKIKDKEQLSEILYNENLTFKSYFAGLKTLLYKLPNKSQNIFYYQKLCKKFEKVEGVKGCEVDTSLLLNEPDCETSISLPISKKLSQLEEDFLGLNKKISCDLFRPTTIEDHPNGLSQNWAQEYTGSDLLRNKLIQNNITLDPEMVGIWDSLSENHGENVANLIASKYSESLIPYSQQMRIINVENVSDYGLYYQKASTDCEQSDRCPEVINNSMSWNASTLIGNVVKSFVQEHKTIFVVAVGNNSVQMSQDSVIQEQLARENKIIGVASLEPDGNPSEFSNFSPEVTISAPSSRIVVSRNFFGINEHFGGTSGAAPQVTAAISAYKLITGHKISTIQAKKLLEKTALKTTNYPIPNAFGSGMLNTYKIGEIAFRIRKQCNQNSECFNNALENDKTYQFNLKEDHLSKLNQYFPSCSMNRKSRVEKSNCEKKEYFEVLRKSALLTNDPSYWKAISCITKKAGFSKNAKFYLKLAKRATQNEEQLIDKIIRDSRNKEIKNLIKFVLTHEKWRNHPKFNHWMGKILKHKKIHPDIAQYILSNISIQKKDHFNKWLNKMIKSKNADSQLIEFVFSRPNIAKHPRFNEYISQFLERRINHANLIKFVLSKEHIKDNFKLSDWSRKLFKFKKLRKEVIYYFFNFENKGHLKQIKDYIKRNKYTAQILSGPILREIEAGNCNEIKTDLIQLINNENFKVIYDSEIDPFTSMCWVKYPKEFSQIIELLLDKKDLDPNFITKILSVKHISEFPQFSNWINKLLGMERFNEDLLNNVFTKVHLFKNPNFGNWINNEINKDKMSMSLISVLSKPHLQSHENFDLWIDKIFDSEENKLEMIISFLSKKHVSKYKKFNIWVERALSSHLHEDAFITYVLSEKHMSQRGDLIEKFIQEGNYNNEILDLLVNYDHWKVHPKVNKWVRYLKAKGATISF